MRIWDGREFKIDGEYDGEDEEKIEKILDELTDDIGDAVFEAKKKLEDAGVRFEEFTEV
jgi:hypothetical protein